MSAGPVLHNRAAVLTTICRILSRSKSDRLMASSTSAVAACCSRASFSSLPKSEAGGRFSRVVAAVARRFVLARLWPFGERDLRAFAALALPPVLDDRAISAPKGQQGHLIGPDHHSGRAGPPDLCLPTDWLMSGLGPNSVVHRSKGFATQSFVGDCRT